MSVNEKGLITAMKEATTSGGYRLYMTDEAVIMGTDWAVVFSDLSVIPRKVLGMIVEHIGDIPKGECYEIFSTKKEIEVIDYMGDVLSSELAAFAGVVDHLMSGDRVKVKYTGVSAWGTYILTTENGQLRTIRPDLLEMIDGLGAAAFTSSGALTVEGEGYAMYVATKGKEQLGTEKDSAIWEALHGVDWWRGGSVASEPQGEQIEMEADDE